MTDSISSPDQPYSSSFGQLPDSEYSPPTPDEPDIPYAITAEPLPDTDTPSMPRGAGLEPACSIIGNELPLPDSSRMPTGSPAETKIVTVDDRPQDSLTGNEKLSTGTGLSDARVPELAGICIVDAAGVTVDLGSPPAAEHAIEARPKTPAETAGESLKAYYKGYKEHGWKEPNGVKAAFPVLTELLEVDLVEDAIQLIDFIGNPKGANSYIRDSYRFSVAMGWERKWTDKLIDSAETHKNTPLGDRAADTLFKVAGEYEVTPLPGHATFLADNLTSALARKVRQADTQYCQDIATDLSGRNLRFAQATRDSEFRRTERAYSRMITTMLRASFGSERTQVARAVLGLHLNPGIKPIIGNLTEYYLNAGAGQILAPLGFNHGALERSWKTGYGNLDSTGKIKPYALTPEQYRLENIKIISRLEHDRPGSAALLHNTLGIHNFARLTMGMVEDGLDLCSGKVNFAKRTGPIALLAQDSLDHNGSAYGDRLVNEKIRQDLKRHKGLLIPVELSDTGSPERLKQKLIDLGVPRIDLLILDNHGHEKTVSSASSPTGIHTTADLHNTGGFIRTFMNDAGFILAYFCSGAKNLVDGTGRILSDSSGLPVVASPAVTSVGSVHLDIDRHGKLIGVEATFIHRGRSIEGVPITPNKRAP